MANLLQPMPIPFEPLRKNRFFLRFPTNLGIAEWYVASAERPKIDINETEIPYLNTSTWVAGKFTWQSINVVLRDPIGPSASQAVQEWIRTCAESVTGRMGYAVGYKKNVDLEMLDPTGVPVQKWVLQGTWIQNADYGSLSYDDDAIADISLTLRFDRAILVF
jgi:hypothetical protein